MLERETSMDYWLTQFITSDVMESLPQLCLIGHEVQDDQAYRRNCLFRSRFKEYHTIQLTISGEGVFKDQNGTYKVPANHAFILRSTDLEVEYWYPENGTEPWKFIFVEFRGGNSRAILAELLEKHGPIFELPPTLERELTKYRKFGGSSVQLGALRSAELVFELYKYLVAATSKKKKDLPNVLLQRAMTYVSNNITKRFNATDLAKEMMVCREHLTRVFSSELQITPNKYIVKERILMACHLLKNTKLGNKEISTRVGIDSQVHFTRTFKKLIGMTPRQFKQSGTSPVFD